MLDSIRLIRQLIMRIINMIMASSIAISQVNVDIDTDLTRTCLYKPDFINCFNAHKRIPSIEEISIEVIPWVKPPPKDRAW